MHIKNKLSTILNELVTKKSCKDVIKNIVLENRFVPFSELQNPWGFIRVLATDENNAKQISDVISKHQNELNVKSVHVIEEALEYHPNSYKEREYNSSVLIKVDSKYLLRSAISSWRDQSQLKNDVLTACHQVVRPRKIVIDFSSPNIAKPFHFGHLKSTILGNYLSNLNKFLGHDVTKLNYIGDWGTQYGLLSLGIDRFGNEFKIDDSRSMLRQLLEIYVRANDLGINDENFYQEAKQRFMQLSEDNQSDYYKQWQKIREVSLIELKESYNKLGIEFDTFEFESDYAKQSIDLVRSMEHDGLVKKLDDGSAIVEVEKNLKPLKVYVLKSDGTSLYITRDIAAAIHRKEEYRFDKMLYVVGVDQEKHFYSLKEIVRKMGHYWADNLKHIKMGKVLGLSSRTSSSSNTLLVDIIDEATSRFIESTKNTITSKVSEQKQLESVGKQLALSSLFVYDMRNPRTRHYELDWTEVMLSSNRTGLNLQASYARLCSLKRKSKENDLEPYDSIEQMKTDAICCIEGMNLVSTIYEMDSAIALSYSRNEPCHLLNYAFSLCTAVNRARQSEKLRILQEENEEYARTRLTLFMTAREQLGTIIRLIGLVPLNKI